MGDDALDKLIFLISNPYIWLFIFFALSLERILIYIRRFYPKSLQEKMKKEEACTLESQNNPKVQKLHRLLSFSILLVAFCSYLLAYHILKYNENKLLHIEPFNTAESMMTISFFVSSLIIIFIHSVYENKINGDKNCNESIIGSKFFNVMAYVLGIPLLILCTLIIILLPRHYTVFNDSDMKFSTLYEWNSSSKAYRDIRKIHFLTKNKCHNIKIYFKDNSVWDLKDYSELNYRGDKRKLVEFVSDKSHIEIEYLKK